MHPEPTWNSNLYGPEKLDLNCEVHMSIDSSFEDQTQGSVPSKPATEPNDPTVKPSRSDETDPMRNPGAPDRERPEDWKDPNETEMSDEDDSLRSNN